mmetsp:Transcript_40804/g.39401  ORF Transcript_40804/g.39401 Transcript_40804/m.39401 type:complete len:124 (-) Transcript_40804:120-491(-)
MSMRESQKGFQLESLLQKKMNSPMKKFKKDIYFSNDYCSRFRKGAQTSMNSPTARINKVSGPNLHQLSIFSKQRESQESKPRPAKIKRHAASSIDNYPQNYDSVRNHIQSQPVSQKHSPNTSV